MHNLFIVIVETSFQSLRKEPPKQGDETSDEEEEKNRMSVRNPGIEVEFQKSKG